jgi:ubiquinone/menaquinone biosynthesis C-methylase UbiE
MESFADPKKILEQLSLSERMTAADFGCGSGGWTIPLAKLLEKGKVYAIDVQGEPLSALRARANLEKVGNIEIVVADVEKGTPLASASVDIVLITNLLCQCYDKTGVMAEAKRVLKPGGKVLIVDWEKDNPLTPCLEKVDFDNLKFFAKSHNLKIEKEFEAGNYHSALILVK